MKFIDYIFGSRRGQEANELEKQSMTDPFLADAMEGFDSVYDNHHDVINDLKQKVTARAEHKTRPMAFVRRKLYLVAGIAAAMLLVASAVLITVSRKPVLENDGIAVNLSPDNDVLSEGVVSSGIAPRSAGGDTSDGLDVASDKQSVAFSEFEDSSSEEQVVEQTVDVLNTVQNSTKIVSATHSSAGSEISDDTAAKPEVASLHTRTMAVDAQGAVVAGDSRAAEVSEDGANAVDNTIRVVRNARFDKYFAANSKALKSFSGGASGSVVVEFRVNDAGIPTSIRVLSGVSQEANRKVIELLVSGPVWEATGDERVRTILKY